MEKNIKKRDDTFDFVKGILILFVVLGHAIQFGYKEECVYHPLFVWIYSFHMPMFFLVSGYFAKKSLEMNFKSCFFSKSRRLLIPALFWTIVVAGIMFFVGQEQNCWHIMLSSIHNMWFLYCLWFIFLMGNVVWHLRNKVIWAIIIAVILIAIYPYHDLDIFKGLQITRQWPEFLLGAVFFSYISLYHSSQKKKLGAIILFLGVMYSIWYWFAGVKNDPDFLFSAENYILRIGVQMIATILFFNVFFLLGKRIVGPVKKIFCMWGEFSMGIYVLHGMMLKLIQQHCQELVRNMSAALLISMVVCFVCVGLVLLIRRVKFLKTLTLGE